MAGSEHRWKFIRAGGVDQVVIRNGGDIVNLDQLDQKLWVALACPTRGVDIEARTLDLIDTDHDGRIRPPELIAAGKWVGAHFADPDLLLEGGDEVPLAAIATDTDTGRALADEARALLHLIGKPDAQTLSLSDLQQRSEVLSGKGLNGDGAVPEAAADDTEVAQLISRIVDTVGGVADRNGKLGVDKSHAQTFFDEAAALRDWHAKGDAALSPLGTQSREAAEAVQTVRAKVDDYFLRCDIAMYDADASEALNPALEQYRALADNVLSTDDDAVARLPLAKAKQGRPLPLRDKLNPAWQQRVAALNQHAVEPLLGSALSELSEDEWKGLKKRLQPCLDWVAAKPQTLLDGVPREELDRLLDPGLRDRLDALIARDAEAAPSNERVQGLEKLLRFKRDLVHLLNNFVSFSEFYSRQGAIFEAGTLYLDERSCQLAIEVNNVSRHAKLAGLAKAYLAYCDCTRGDNKKTIVVAFTAGDVDYLFAGRNGVFYDRKGDDWDATITQVIENPMSIRQAFFSPYKKFVRLIEEQIAKRAAASEKKSEGALGSIAERSAAPVKSAKADSVSTDTKPSNIDVGTVAALGVALGSISAVLVGVFAKFVEMGWWIPVGLLGIMLAISGPSMLIAWLKLRQRSLGPILDASGWAINGRMRINVPLGASLTANAEVPASAERRLRDPYRESRVGRLLVVLVVIVVAAVVIAWRSGWFASVATG